MKKIFTLLLLAAMLNAGAKTTTNTGAINTKDSAATATYNTPTANSSVLLNATVVLKDMLQSATPVKTILAYTKQLRPLDIHYFPGTSNENALVIGGVHGSELSSVSVARTLVDLLSNSSVKPYYNVIVIPSLFPDNAALASQYKSEIGSTANIGRYTDNINADPNRQMPPFGKAFNETTPVDFAGRTIEMENQLLLQVIQIFKPSRIANLHAIRDKARAGVYADPRTDCNGIAQGYHADSTLAVNMAKHIYNGNGCAPGNNVAGKPTALYYCDPAIAPAGSKQARNIHGSQLAGNRGFGVSLGGWASTAVCDDNAMLSRPAMILLTVEFPGNKRPEDYEAKSESETCAHNVIEYAKALHQVFLSNED